MENELVIQDLRIGDLMQVDNLAKDIVKVSLLSAEGCVGVGDMDRYMNLPTRTYQLRQIKDIELTKNTLASFGFSSEGHVGSEVLELITTDKRKIVCWVDATYSIARLYTAPKRHTWLKSKNIKSIRELQHFYQDTFGKPLELK